MRRPRLVLSLVLTSAAAAAAVPLVASAASGDPVLPDLRADPPANPYYEVYTDGRLLLRFDGYVTNVGAGPLDISGNPKATVYQRVLKGGTLVEDHPVPVKYETADGHDHFHLMQIMRYSLRDAAGNEVAPGQKVGFCLYDYSYATNFSGTRAPQVYGTGRPGDTFCHRNNPDATDLNMGVGSGWRDDYGGYLALQWVDVSDTTPGVYRLAAEADPNKIIRESNDVNPIALSTSAIAVPGYVPKAIGPLAVSPTAQTAIPLESTSYGSPNPVVYSITSQPSRGSVAISGANAVYTPGPGAPGTYTFTYAAAQSGSPYPRTKRTATVTLTVGAAVAASVSISGAPSSMIAGTTARLSATLVNGSGGVAWSASAGSITPDGLYTAPAAPPAGGNALITATSISDRSLSSQVAIAIRPAPPVVPAPGGPGTGTVIPVAGLPLPKGVVDARLAGSLSAPQVSRSRRTIVVRVTPTRTGTLRVAAIRGKARVARCRAHAVMGKRTACRLVLPRRLATTPVRIVVALATPAGTATRTAFSTP